MCFRIDKDKKWDTTTTVYKYVDNYLGSPVWPKSSASARYYNVGRTVKALKEPWSSLYSFLGIKKPFHQDPVYIYPYGKDNYYAKKGIYVYKDLYAAKYDARKNGGTVIELKVKPKDFIYSDYTGVIGTYRKVKVERIIKRYTPMIAVQGQHIYCRGCYTPSYRVTRDIRQGDVIKASNFVPLRNHIPPMKPGDSTICKHCGLDLRHIQTNHEII